MSMEVNGHRISTDEWGEVICPWDTGEAPRGWRHKRYLASECAYYCSSGHLHKLKEFPELNTNDIKPGQIHTRG